MVKDSAGRAGSPEEENPSPGTPKLPGSRHHLESSSGSLRKLSKKGFTGRWKPQKKKTKTKTKKKKKNQRVSGGRGIMSEYRLRVEYAATELREEKTSQTFYV